DELRPYFSTRATWGTIPIVPLRVARSESCPTFYFSFGQNRAKPSTLTGRRYSDFPAVTYNVFLSLPPKQQFDGVSGVATNASCLPSGLNTYSPPLSPLPAMP